jgi:hypothetical protein
VDARVAFTQGGSEQVEVIPTDPGVDAQQVGERAHGLQAVLDAFLESTVAILRHPLELHALVVGDLEPDDPSGGQGGGNTNKDDDQGLKMIGE